MPNRSELVLRASAVNVNHLNYPNDSKLEQRVLYAEKTLTASGAATTTLPPAIAVARVSGDKPV